VLVVQGEHDPFGMPVGGPARSVVVVPGNHSLSADLEAVGAAVRSWLSELSSDPRFRAPAQRARGPTA
jgi:hypothetical protein